MIKHERNYYQLGFKISPLLWESLPYMVTESADSKVSKMEIVTDFEMPDEAPRETKYPWRELAEAGTGKGKKTVLIAADNEESAKTLKGNLISSGFSFYSRNDLPYQVVARAAEIERDGEKKWVVAVQIKDRAVEE